MNESNRKFLISSIIIPILSGVLAILVPIIEKQPSFAHSFIVGFLLFFYCSLSCFFVIPFTNKRIIEFLKESKVSYYLLIIVVVLLPLISWVFVDSVKISVFSFFIWYAIPALILIIPTFLEDFSYDFAFHLISVIIIAVGFDRRYTYEITPGIGFQYELNALMVSSLILASLSVQIDDFSKKFNWGINKNKLLLPLSLSGLLAIITIPIGLVTNFLSWSPQWPGTLMFFFSFIGIWLTIALPEEIIARGVIQHQLTKNVISKENKYFKYWKWGVLIVASAIFGLSHWNNTTPELAWVYILLATIAGAVYGICWWKGGLLSAMLIHTIVDWIWALLFVTP